MKGKVCKDDLPDYCVEKRDKTVPEAGMSNKNQAVLAAFLSLVVVVLGGVAVLKGGLFIGKHEGDTLHLMQIVFRLVDGQTPHLDFMTPIGVLAFWPIAMLVKAGFGIGMAVIWTQVITAALFVPIIVWITRSRLRPRLAGFFGLIVLVLLLALVHGESEGSISISMHYNRLAWAASFVAILAAMIPPKRPNTATIDGVVIGMLVCILALTKMTYLVSFAVPTVVALLMTGQRRALAVAVVTGVLTTALITLFVGFEFWAAYAQDLLTVAGSDVRSAPGASFTDLLSAPAYMGATGVAFGGVVLLRQAKIMAGGLVLLLLIPGFVYVTYQNYGNDPQWLMLLGVLLLALRDEASDEVNDWGWKLRDAIGVAAAVSLAFIAPSFFNMGYSPVRNFNADVTSFSPILPRSAEHADLQSYDARVNRVDARVALDGQWEGLPIYEERDPLVSFMGEEFSKCSVELGLIRLFDTISRDIESSGLAEGKSLFAADVFPSYWLFGALEPMDQGAPWYYGGLPGIEDADYLMIPMCPVVPYVQNLILEQVQAKVDEGSIRVNEIRRTDLYVLYALDQ